MSGNYYYYYYYYYYSHLNIILNSLLDSAHDPLRSYMSNISLAFWSADPVQHNNNNNKVLQRLVNKNNLDIISVTFTFLIYQINNHLQQVIR